MNLKNNLNRVLKDRDLTISQLSRMAQVPKSTISEWRTGGVPRDLNKVKRLADALGLTIDELCFGDGITKRSNSLADFKEEIFAGNFDVILRKVNR